jgi:hypothetical protein
MFDRYIFVFKARSFEIHSMDILLNATQPTFTATPISQHLFQNTTFREVRISSPTISTSDQLDIRFQMFTYDVLQGLFNYSIHFQTRPEQPPHFAVALPNVYPLANHAVSQHAPLPPSDLYTPSPTPTNEVGHAFRPITNPSSRGFVSSFALGAQGRRAVWVERVRGNTRREIHAWSRPGTTEDEVVVNEQPEEIERIPVYSIASPDLRGTSARLCTLHFLTEYLLQRI